MSGILISCDAVNQLQYSVLNKTDKSKRLHVPRYPIDPSQGVFSVTVDTIIEVQPNQSVWVGTSPRDIDFPWATKNIYKKAPGICGLELVQNDSLIELDCTESRWKYKNRWSTLKLK